MSDKTDITDIGGGAPAAPPSENSAPEKDAVLSAPKQKSGEIGGPPGPEPTRYGDWELKGRCTDF
jgi:hypothetical protein